MRAVQDAPIYRSGAAASSRARRTADRLLWSGAVSRGMGVAFAGTWSDVGAAELGCFIGDLLGRDTPATLGRHTQPSFYGPGW